MSLIKKKADADDHRLHDCRLHAPAPRAAAQTDLEDFIRDRLVVAVVGDMVGATPPADAATPAGDSVDALAARLRDLTSVGPCVRWAAPSSVRGSASAGASLVMVSWDSVPRMRRDGASRTARAGFFATAAEGLRHAIDFERISAEQGEGPAEVFHLAARCKSEVEAVRKLEERAGVDRPDPHAGDPSRAHRSAEGGRRR